MENHHHAITGARELSPEEVVAMNEVKAKAVEVGTLISRLQAMPGIDQRAVAIAKTELQTGFMWAVRGIAQPTTF